MLLGGASAFVYLLLFPLGTIESKRLLTTMSFAYWLFQHSLISQLVSGVRKSFVRRREGRGGGGRERVREKRDKLAYQTLLGKHFSYFELIKKQIRFPEDPFKRERNRVYPCLIERNGVELNFSS